MNLLQIMQQAQSFQKAFSAQNPNVNPREFEELNNQYTALSAQLQQIISAMQAQSEKKETKK